MTLSKALAALILAIPASATPPVDNGIETGAGEYAQVVKLTIEGRYMCSGTIVGLHTILTAAHCLDHSDPDHPNITVDLPGGHGYAADRLLLHPKWDGPAVGKLNDAVAHFGEWSKLSPSEQAQARQAALARADVEQYDIGLVAVSFFDTQVVPARIVRGESDLVGQAVTIVGYGANDRSAWAFNGAGTKRKGDNRIAAAWRGLLFTVGLTRARIYEYGGLKEQADGKDAGVDHGDSGGPIFADGAVIGVNAAGISEPAEFETLREELGTAGEKLYQETRSGKKGWDVYVSLSSPASAELFQIAKMESFDVRSEEAGAADRARSPISPKSQTLQGLTQETDRWR